jgi:hypothetical protein
MFSMRKLKGNVPKSSPSPWWLTASFGDLFFTKLKNTYLETH